jgi:hypothetical protein
VSGKSRSGSGFAERLTEYLRGNVLGLIAIFIALSGTAVANFKVGSSDIARTAVRAGHIAKKQVRAKHLARNAVRPPHLAKRAVRPRHLMPGAVKNWAIANGAITADKLADDVGREGPAGPTGPTGPQGPPGDPASVDGNPMGGDLTGAFPDPSIAAGAVTAGKIDNGAITPVKLQNAAVQTNKIADGAVTAEKLAEESVRGRNFFISGTYQLNNPGSIAAGACSGMYLFRSPGGPAVGVASLAPQTPAGVFATVNYLNNAAQLGVRICNTTASAVAYPAYFNYVFIEL